jgi:hypothetical protein
LDQGTRCNTCTAHALAATMSDLTRLGGEGVARSLSPDFIHQCIGRKSCVEGLDPAEAISGARTTAVPLVDGNETYDPQRCASAQGMVRIGTSNSLWGEDDAFAALERGPVFAVMDLYEDFWSWYQSGIYRHGAGPWLSTHSIEIVGYDRPQSYWIIKNSRGPIWGEQGYARVAFGECGILMATGHGGVQLIPR